MTKQKHRPKKILVLDDEEKLGLAYKWQLERAGYSAFALVLKTDGYDWTIQNRPDLIISDINAPVMDGFTFLRLLRANPFTGKVPLIFLTASSGQGIAAEAFKLGATDFITKPCEAGDLLERISKILKDKHFSNPYPASFDFNDVSHSKFLPWCELERRVRDIVVHHSAHSVVLPSRKDSWSLRLVLESDKEPIGGSFVGPFDFIGSVTGSYILSFREFLDGMSLDAGVIYSFQLPIPFMRAFAGLLGIHFYPPSSLNHYLNLKLKPVAVVNLLKDRRSRLVSLSGPDQGFRSFADVSFMEIKRLEGSTYDLSRTQTGDRPEHLVQKSDWRGVTFCDHKDEAKVVFSHEFLWHNLAALWLTGFYRLEDSFTDSRTEAVLRMFLPRLSTFQEYGFYLGEAFNDSAEEETRPTKYAKMRPFFERAHRITVICSILFLLLNVILVVVSGGRIPKGVILIFYVFLAACTTVGWLMFVVFGLLAGIQWKH